MMSTLGTAILAMSQSTELVVIAKASVIIMMGLIALTVARSARAAIRHAIMTAAFAALFALPIMGAILPATTVHIPVASASAETQWLESPDVLPGSAPDTVASQPTGLVPSQSLYSRVTVPTLLRMTWFVGLLGCLVPVVTGLMALRRLRRTGVTWAQGSHLSRSIAPDLARNGRIRFLLHDRVAVPITYGLVRPVVIFPAGADRWSEVDLTNALAHEIAHIRRGDSMVHLVARVVCTVYWFHPGVWTAWRRLCLEAERACDDVVLKSAEQTAYADQLVRLARELSRRYSGYGLSMASRSDLFERVTAVLNSRQTRGSVGVRRGSTIGALALLVVAALAPLQAMARATVEARLLNPRRIAGYGAALSPSSRSALLNAAHNAMTPTNAVPREADTQSRAADESTSVLDYVSVSTNPAGRSGVHRGPLLEGNQLIAIGVQPRWLIFAAYGMSEYQLIGGPDWISQEYVDVIGTVRGPAKKEELKSLLRTILEDRFHLVVHRETRDTPVYALVLADPNGPFGPHFQRGAADCAALRAAAGGGLARTGIPCGVNLQVGRLAGRGFPMEQLAGWLSRHAGRMVIDRTGLDGVFDFDLTFTPEQLRNVPPGRFPTVDPDGPSIFTAVQEQLGLKLDPLDSLGDVLVIDRIERPE
jgi:uncharacterized protein (TIGR03435 family)